MPVYKLQVSFGADSAMIRDRFIITPHFRIESVVNDPDALCGDLATALAGWASQGREIEVKAYDAQGTPPVYPVGQAMVNGGVYPQGSYPREIACCLSFYSVRNIKRQRGRLYIPHAVLGTAPELRPGGGTRSKVMALGPIFSALGGPDVDWVVFSRVDNVARPVTNYWCDDEWDTMRSRGLRATMRDLATTSEA